MSNAYEIREDGAGYWCIAHGTDPLTERLTLAQAIKEACRQGRLQCESTAQTTYVQMVMPGSSITLALLDGTEYGNKNRQVIPLADRIQAATTTN